MKGIAHVTGGGIPGNLPRAMKDGSLARIRTEAWERPPIFDFIQKTGKIEPAEMFRTFNCGIGMTAIVPAADAESAVEILEGTGEKAYVIGEVVAGEGPAAVSLLDRGKGL